MLYVATMADPVHDQEDGDWVMTMATDRVPMGTQLVASLHWRSIAESVLGATVICAMSSVAEMHVIGLRTGA
jgi:hypothetical protein